MYPIDSIYSLKSLYSSEFYVLVTIEKCLFLSFSHGLLLVHMKISSMKLLCKTHLKDVFQKSTVLSVTRI